MVGNNIMQRKDKLENVDRKFTPNIIKENKLYVDKLKFL